MTHPNEERIKETAKLIKERDHAINMVNRWQTKLDETNASLALMLGGTEPVAAPEPVAEPV
jgi:hypothetical protein